YEETEVRLEPGQVMLLHSDGVAEAHSGEREMFGFPRLLDVVGSRQGGEVIDRVLTELDRFTPHGWEQEDDITLVTLRRTGISDQGASCRTDPRPDIRRPDPGGAVAAGRAANRRAERVLAEFAVPSQPGIERLARDKVAASAAECGLSEPSLERLKTAVAEAVMNAAEHGNHNRPDLTVDVRVTWSGDRLVVAVSDFGGGPPDSGAVLPDLDLKLAGEQSPRGWGLFLIRNMVDAMDVTSDGCKHTVLLTMHASDADGRRDHDGQPV
ncbi:MAG: ATP-binding SpoIIE family protein phosphatase, partial [Gemmatimonadales bacterium]